MRTTISMDPDVAAAVEQTRRSEHLGLSEAVNRLIRRGVHEQRLPRAPFRQRTADLGGALVDVSNVAETLDLLDDHP